MGEGWFATASSWSDDREEAYCKDSKAIKDFIDQHADKPEITLIRFERSVANP